jgi:8-oxo-dGTP pyrophosphatase MutT (NUDIX family)
MEKKAGIFLVNKKGEILIGHPTNHKQDMWSIPKGKLEEGETNFQAALRETYEETNVNLKDVELDMIYELPRVKYKSGKKSIFPFVILECNNNLNFDDFDVKCNAIVPKDASWNAGLPEFDEFKWASFDEAEELLHESQSRCVKSVKEIFKICYE